MHALWFEGTDHGLVWSHGLALVSGEVPAAAAADIWVEFAEGGDLATFLKVLSVHTGTDVLSLPGFAIALRTSRGDWQLAARGAWSAQVEDDVVRGTGISTWAERSVAGGSAARVGRIGDPAEGRPLVAGVVVAGGLAWGEVVPSPEDAPAPPAVVQVPDWAATLIGDEDVSLPAPVPPAVHTPPAVETSPVVDAPSVVDAPPVVIEPPRQAPSGEPSPEMVEVPRAAPPGAAAPQGRFARQYGDTELFSIEDAAVRTEGEDFIAAVPGREEPGPAPTPSAPAPADAREPEPAGDHDGHTVLASDFASGPTAPTDEGEAGEETGPELSSAVRVLGISCPQGHANPPHRTTCFECEAPVSGAARQLPRPLLGRLALPNGETIPLDAPLLIGRNPRVERHQGTVLPRLVPLSQGHVSSNHLEVRLEDWNVLAVDLHSTNGTFLRRRGEAPVRLGERPELLMDGDVLDLGHGVQIVVEGVR